MVKATGNGIRILERCKFRFRFHSFFNDYACNSHNFSCNCEMPLASQLLFLWQNWSRYPILEVCEFQFWQFCDSSCHVFIRILAVSRWHLIDPSSIEHNNSACNYTKNKKVISMSHPQACHTALWPTWNDAPCIIALMHGDIAVIFNRCIWLVHHSFLVNMMWLHFYQSMDQLVVDHTNNWQSTQSEKRSHALCT